MHNSNQYYLRAITAEKELAILTDKAHQLFEENRTLTRNHIYALRVIEGLGSTMGSRRHRLASMLGRLINAPEMAPAALAAMLVGIRTALAGLPSPPSPSAAPEPTPPPSEPERDQAESPGLRIVTGGRDE